MSLRHTGDTKILLLGADGMLGKAWEQFLVSRGLSHDAVSRSRTAPHHLDVTDAQAVDARLARGYEWVINCTAYTAVDAAETDESTARKINAVAVGQLGEAAARHGVRVVHYGTDYVFSGDAETPYPVDAPVAPINVYGKTKAEGESLLRASGAAHLLLRTSWVYAPWGKNFVLTMRRLMNTTPQVTVVDDQRGRPTSVFTLVDATWALMERVNANARDSERVSDLLGTYHVTDSGECTWFELAKEIRDVIGAPCEVLPCSTSAFPRPARRPAYGVLDLGRTEAVTRLPNWREALRNVLGQVETGA
jgi:dTDP-4-dehydrorhamnose reductase